jgi:hypothetical protein
VTHTMKISLAEDKSKATVEFLPSSRVSVTLELTADELLKLVHGLGQVHATMVADGSQTLEGQKMRYERFWQITL